MTLQFGTTNKRAALPTGPNPKRYVASTGAEHRHSIPTIEIDVTRTGEGSGPNVTISDKDQGIVMTSTSLGFPVIATTAIPNDRIAVARLQAAPNGAKWSEVTLHTDTVLIYGPGTHHTAISPEGLTFQAALLPIDQVLQSAEMLKMDVHIPAEGSVTTLDHGHTLGGIAEVLSGYGTPNRHDRIRAGSRGATASAVVQSLGSTTRSARRSVDSKHIVRLSVDYADIIYGIPAMADLCLVAHVSERRLRQAFVDTVGLPPKRYLLMRQLSRIRDSLESGDKATTTVTRVALEAGVTHLSRFAQRYREIFEERPSDTLAREGNAS